VLFRSVDVKNNERFLVTTTAADFSRDMSPTTPLDSTTKRPRDPYYVKDAPITYYLHTALHSDSFDFPSSSVGNLDRIWLKGSSFTQSTRQANAKKSETFENPSLPPTMREVQQLKKLRFDIVTACASISPSTARGGSVQTLTQKLLDLDTPAGRAPVADISAVVALYTGVELSVPQQNAVVIAFSRLNDERIVLIEFIEYLRGGLSSRSKEYVFRIWDSINSQRKDFVSEDEVISAMKRNINREIKNTILDSLHLYSSGREAYELADLVEYYRDVYAEVADDADFKDLLQSTWAGAL